ncbi:MAG: YcaQ family DNA glycosylase [Vicinamibacteria bacterium]|nr:YcaQ family DNA glycosylase [Vicinamibacteria bacterium]
MPAVTLDALRRFAVARALFPPTTLKRAVERLGFVQADPIRAPARAQDLTLRHRVKGYRAGDLERRYHALGIEEDVFVNYGFVSRRVHALMHPRGDRSGWTPTRKARAALVLEFVRERGAVHPRQVDEHFAHGTVTNYWGGSSSATTHLLEHMHYRGLLRVMRREKGIRVYAVREIAILPEITLTPRERVDALIDVVVNKYAPLPGKTLSFLVNRLRYGVPQWRRELKPALMRAKQRLAHARVDSIDWYWPVGEDPQSAAPDDQVRLLAPFDPIVWDRRRFELLWGWPYRFEAYTPVAKRKLGYYALPLLWRDRVVGWGNLTVVDDALTANFGYAGAKPPRELIFKRGLDAELESIRSFLRLQRGP